jgi:arylsulfatase A-like enzyme
MLRISLLASVVLGALVGATQAVGETRPNIVVFLTDDMGWGQVGFQGGKQAATPNIDRLAREGARLSQFYVQSVCSPTRAALLTGRYPFRNGMEERSHASDTAGMLTDERTLAQALREAGYFTALFGKWHLGEWKKEHLPLARGFDHQYGHYSALIDSFGHRRGAVYDWHRNEQPIDEPGYSTFLIADEFARVLEQHEGSKPFFFYVPFNAVHGPHDAPPEYLERHGGDKQLAMLECMDVAVGRMLAALEKQGVLDDTLVVFFNDNGGPKRIGNAPLRGAKGTTYEGGVRVPCAIRWPGKIAAGSQVAGLVHVVDLYPTLVGLAGGSLKQPLPLDGVDVWPAIAAGRPSPRTEVVHSVPGFERSVTGPPSIRSGDFKLIGEELYDLKADPYETTDLAAKHPDKVGELQSRLAALAAERREPETHGRIPGGAPIVYGEQESAGPIPEWLARKAEEAKSLPPRPKRKRRLPTGD